MGDVTRGFSRRARVWARLSRSNRVSGRSRMRKTRKLDDSVWCVVVVVATLQVTGYRLHVTRYSFRRRFYPQRLTSSAYYHVSATTMTLQFLYRVTFLTRAASSSRRVLLPALRQDPDFSRSLVSSRSTWVRLSSSLFGSRGAESSRSSALCCCLPAE